MKEIRMLDMNVSDSQEDNKMILEGYAVKFNSPATHGFTEIIDRKAFDKCDMSDVCLKYNHSDTNYILARTRNHSLQLSVDDIGVRINAELIDTTTNRDIYKMVQSGLLDKMSFAFTVSDEEWDYDTDTRRITGIDKLFDVAVVDVPFYDSTEVYARSEEEFKEEKQKYEALKLAKAKAKMKLSLN